MPKRKRSDYERPLPEDSYDNTTTTDPSAEESTRSIAIQQSTISQKIHHSRTLLKRALKTAKGFEQQKLGKRIKAARKGKDQKNGNKNKNKNSKKDGKEGRKEEDEVERLEKEIEALKHIDLAELATRHLNKLLVKNRPLSNSRYFPPEIAKEVEEQAKTPVPTGPVANVCARMLNANPVKESVKEIVGNLSRLLGIEGGNEDSGKPTKESEKVEKKVKESKAVIHGADKELEDEEDDDSEEDDSESSSKDNSEDAVIHPSMLKSLAAKYLRNSGAVSSDESESEDEDDGRIAWSSEDDGEGEDEEDISESEDDRPRGRSMSITPIPEDELRKIEALEDEALDIDLSDEEEEGEEGSNSDVSSPPPKKSEKSKPKKQAAPALAPAPTGPIKSSSFLPTLMTGYISGSDSDAASDISAENKSRKSKKKGPPEKKIRKNRMGQQARRALAEKMYGTGANHVKKAKEEKEAKVKAKEDRKKAWEEKQTKAVHVSWQLKKKEKDEKDRIVKDMMAGKGAGAGKKIVFD
ncbi:hypothetical protein AOL_s00215g71 [Orbilia oligospora ATCC 24927]|uniref:Bud22 domain-containing protein n=1 Tax=Arthrobotrys oligospora (strain ATCC 24927 / CBS 115.81 / DSM 1491) TaxID=756982 RepID=G1XTE2_ARTOA|nr:hypothetical protein AOL_s00215g71 [Orbilia oligospora ATCC 24927]EGX43335.1 hypothetical protein AOL_s00215g71 [Orbilia oligospora ATCC 24927]